MILGKDELSRWEFTDLKWLTDLSESRFGIRICPSKIKHDRAKVWIEWYKFEPAELARRMAYLIGLTEHRAWHTTEPRGHRAEHGASAQAQCRVVGRTSGAPSTMLGHTNEGSIHGPNTCIGSRMGIMHGLRPSLLGTELDRSRI